jgi:hypothetical protein
MKRLLHVIAQIPGRTGSGIYLKELVSNASDKGYKQAVVFGTPSYQVDSSSYDSTGIDSYPVLFETDELPFPVVGMSDTMPLKQNILKSFAPNSKIR